MSKAYWRGGAVGLVGLAVVAACSGGSTTIINQYFGDDGGADTSSPDAESGPSDGSTHDASAGDGGSAATNGDGGADAGDAGFPTQSCATGGPGFSDCGPDAGNNCCESQAVPGGTFYRVDQSNGVLQLVQADCADAGCAYGNYAATVSSFRLDKYEVTIGRFRPFFAAWDGGWRPAVGSGKHSHVRSGMGLVKAPWNDAGVAYEDGWNTAWNGSAIIGACISDGEDLNPYRWNAVPGSHEAWPMDCMSWEAAYAFCIWDGGFLPTQAEWDYAAAGGSEQRFYPWSVPPSDQTLDCAHANFDPATPCFASTTRAGALSPIGDGKWGHADLAGNVAECVLDSWHDELDFGNFGTNNAPGLVYQCQNDCADFEPGKTWSGKYLRGGAYEGPKLSVAFNGGLVSVNTKLIARNLKQYDGNAGESIGFRCARMP